MIRKTLPTCLAIAVLAITSLTVSQPANAKMHGKRMMKAKTVRLRPSQQKPSYHGIPAGGPMMLIDIPQVPAGGGVLNAGLLPSTGVFKGVPILGDVGF